MKNKVITTGAFGNRRKHNGIKRRMKRFAQPAIWR